MLEWLENLFADPVDSEGQLRQAQAKQETYTAQQNEQARSRGYRNASAMVEFEKQRMKKRPSSIIAKGQSRVQAGIDTVQIAHPKGVLERVTAALGEATGGD